MEIEKYIENVKKMMTHGFSENIICRILEEEGKDRRTNTMYGKDEITQGEPQKQEIEASNKPNKTVNPITPKQFKALVLMSKDLEGEEYLKSKGIRSEKDLEKLTKKEAWEIMNERK